MEFKFLQRASPAFAPGISLPEPAFPGPAPQRERRQWLDVARGIGMILVVIGHMLRGLVSTHLWPAGPLAAWIDYSLYTFHMPLFFYLSALNVRASLRRGPGAFLMSKIWNIAYPYFLWSLIQGGIIMAMGRGVNMPITGADLANIWFRPFAQFWFLYALMICHVLAVLVPGRRPMLVLSVLGFVVFESLTFRSPLALTLHDLPAYAIGLCGYNWISEMPRHRKTLLVALSVGFVAAVLAGGAESGMNPSGLLSVPAEILGIACVVLFSRALQDYRVSWLALVGRMSMTIYILHLLAGAGTRIILQRLHAPLDPYEYLLVCTSMAIILPMGAHVTLQRLHLLGPSGFGWPKTAGGVI
jgi:fucose 4-O-acetylase-like acetyltransferase